MTVMEIFRRAVVMSNDEIARQAGIGPQGEPFGEEWKAEIMRMRKADIVGIFRQKCIDAAGLEAERDKWMDNYYASLESAKVHDLTAEQLQGVVNHLDAENQELRSRNRRGRHE